MGVILTDYIADDTRRFLVGAIPVVGQLVHREQNPAVHRFQTIPHIRERPSDYDAHGVIEIRTPHLLFEAYRYGFFGECVHEIFGEIAAKSTGELLRCKAFDFSTPPPVESSLDARSTEPLQMNAATASV